MNGMPNGGLDVWVIHRCPYRKLHPCFLQGFMWNCKLSEDYLKWYHYGSRLFVYRQGWDASAPFGPIPPPNQSALSRARSILKMPPFSWVVKYQNSSKTHLFQELENTLIFRWHYDTILSPQMLILPMSSSNKCQLFWKHRYFLAIFHF